MKLISNILQLKHAIQNKKSLNLVKKKTYNAYRSSTDWLNIIILKGR